MRQERGLAGPDVSTRAHSPGATSLPCLACKLGLERPGAHRKSHHHQPPPRPPEARTCSGPRGPRRPRSVRRHRLACCAHLTGIASGPPTPGLPFLHISAALFQGQRPALTSPVTAQPSSPESQDPKLAIPLHTPILASSSPTAAQGSPSVSHTSLPRETHAGRLPGDRCQQLCAWCRVGASGKCEREGRGPCWPGSSVRTVCLSRRPRRVDQRGPKTQDEAWWPLGTHLTHSGT